MAVSTRNTTRPDTPDGQRSQDSQSPSDTDETPAPDVNENVRRPMTLRQMQEMVDNQVLSPEQLRILGERIQGLVRIRTGKRAHEDSENEDDRPRKRKADHDLKYTNIKELKIGATLKAWSDWKIEIQRAFDASPYKYDNDCTKVIKALSHLDEDSKTLWNNYIRTNPDAEYDWEAFIAWLDTTVRDQGNDEVAIQIEWAKARQRFDQTPWAFDAHLTSLEREMEPKGERTRAMEFFSRLRYSLRRAIRLSGINPLPQTRQAMLSLATRMWEEIKHEERDPRKKPFNENKAPKTTPPTTAPPPSSQKDTTRPLYEKKAENKLGRPRGPKEFASGKNDKGERICFTCGSTSHLASFHKKDDKDNTDEKKPGVHIVKTTTGRKKGQERTAETVWGSLSDSSDSEND